MKHLSFIEQLAYQATNPTKQLKLRSWQENPKMGSEVWIPGRGDLPEKVVFEPHFRLCFEPYNRGELFQKEWQCAEYMLAKRELAMKYQMKFYGVTVQEDLFGNLENMEMVDLQAIEKIQKQQSERK